MAKKKKSADPRIAQAGGISRRDFSRRAALAAASVAMLPSHLLAQAEGPTTPAAQPAAQQPSEQPKLSPEGRAEVEAKIQSIFRKYGQRLSEEQKADVRRLVAEGQKPLESLRAFPLDNADGPATVLKLYPEPERTPRGATKPRGHARQNTSPGS